MTTIFFYSITIIAGGESFHTTDLKENWKRKEIKMEYKELIALAEKVKFRIDEALYFKINKNPKILIGIIHEILDNALNEIQEKL